jgi:hypothetical protein
MKYYIDLQKETTQERSQMYATKESGIPNNYATDNNSV